jgi:hypothetical protein
MIVYDLECDNEHRFEGWFGSAGEFDDQLARKILTCPVCNSGSVVRRPSAAYVNTGAAREHVHEREEAPAQPSPAARASRKGGHRVPVNVPQPVANVPQEMIAKVIEHVIKNSEDVGERFPEEARKIHYNEAPARHIRGTASTREVDELNDEGIEVMALPMPVGSGSRH